MLPGALLGASLVVVGVGRASAHEGDPRLILDPPTVAPGGGVRVVGEDLEPGSEIRLTIEGVEQSFAVAQLVVDPAGHFSREIALPPAMRAGVYGVKAQAGGELVASEVLVVAEGADPGVAIDRSPPWAAIGGVSLAVGALLLVLRLRRRRWGRSRSSRAPRPRWTA